MDSSGKDPLNVLLAWSDREVKRSEGDLFVTEGPLDEGQVEATEAPDETATDPTAAAFEWSEDRARAIDAALMRLGQAPSARVCAMMTDLLEQRNSPDFAQRLDTVEAWLQSQLPHWGTTVRPRPAEATDSPGADEDRALVGSYNEALSSASGGIHLALEVVAMLRSGEPHQLALAEPLLRQVNDFFQLARQQLLAAEPPPAE